MAKKNLLQGDGYDWVLNEMLHIEVSDHALHLDDAIYDRQCFHCREGAGRRVAPVVRGTGTFEPNPDWGKR